MKTISLTFPKDTEARKIASKGRQIVHNIFNVDRWEYREKTGNDVGVDAELEFSNQGEFRNEKFECQIKATENIVVRADGDVVFNKFPVKTMNYALNSRLVFIFLLVDVTNNVVYFLKLDNQVSLKADYNDQKTITLYVPQDNILPDKEKEIISYIVK